MAVPYRLIALDVDGTLLNTEHQLSEGTKDAVRRAVQTGASIVLCTGRGPSETFAVLEELGLSGTLITHNGATTVHSGDRALLHGFSYSLEDIGMLIRYCREHGVHYNTNDIFDLYIDRITPDAETMYGIFGIHPIRVDDLSGLERPVYKSTLFGSVEALDRLTADWQAIGCKLHPIRSDDRFIDVMHPEASKGNALRKLSGMLGIPREQVLAIGNYYNDIDMLRFAGLGIAMANSPEEVKEAADEVTVSNNEDGVRAALLKHVLL
jgi:Cof subfamily protein (haloacid dehalogenase superfamily)